MRSDWNPYTLDQLGSVGRGKSRHRPRNDPRLYGGAYPFFQTGDITKAEFYLHDFSATYNEVGLAQSKLWQPGTLCITIAANIAETALLAIPGCFPDSVVEFVAYPGMADARFIKYYIDLIKLQMQDVSRGTTQSNLSLDKLLRFEFHVPSLGEQREIGGAISAYDDLIENNTRRIAILEEMARRIFEEWFVHFLAPGCEGLPMVDTAIGPVPQGWEVKALRQLAEEIRDPADPRAIDPDTPYVGLEHIPRRSTTFGDWGKAGQVGSLKLKFQTGDILFGKIRPYFHKCAVAPVEGVASSDAIIIRPKQDVRAVVTSLTSSDAFVAHAVKTSNGTKMPRADWKVLREYPIAVPPDDLVQRFEQTVWATIELGAKLAAQNRNLRAQRDLLLPKLISGEIDVSRSAAALPEAAE